MSTRIGLQLAALVVPVFFTAHAESGGEDKVRLTGTAVGENGKPLRRKNICLLVPAREKGEWSLPLSSAEGKLYAPRSRTNAKGRFSLRVERQPEVRLAVCPRLLDKILSGRFDPVQSAGEQMVADQRSPTITIPAEKKTVKLGKVVLKRGQ